MKKLVAALAVLVGMTVQAQTVLGTTRLARHHTDLDVIKLTPAKCGLSAVKLKVLKRQADIEEVAVQYKATGNWDFLPVRRNFRRGSTSRWIDLRGDRNRCIKRIAVVGDSDGLPLGRANIVVLGK